MESIYAIVASCMIAIGFYMMLSRHLLKIIFGLMIIGNAVNLVIFTAGRITGTAPPFISATPAADVIPLSHALPQALILTAIVIGFGLLAFALGLVLRMCRDIKSLDIEVLQEVEHHNQIPPILHDGTMVKEAA